MHLSQTSKAPALHLAQSAAAAHECNYPNYSHGGQCLEEVPRGIVEEKDPFERDQGSQEHGMGERRRLQCGGEMVHVDTEEEPLEINTD